MLRAFSSMMDLSFTQLSSGAAKDAIRSRTLTLSASFYSRNARKYADTDRAKCSPNAVPALWDTASPSSRAISPRDWILRWGGGNSADGASESPPFFFISVTSPYLENASIISDNRATACALPETMPNARYFDETP